LANSLGFISTESGGVQNLDDYLTGYVEGCMVTLLSAVPEPASYALMGMGLLLVAGRARRWSRSGD